MKLRTYCLACREHTGNIGSKKVKAQIKQLETNQDVLNVFLVNQDL